MRSVKDVPWEELKIGDRVRSIIGQPGTIKDLTVSREHQVGEQRRVIIDWAGGENPSDVLHEVISRVIYVGPGLIKVSFFGADESPKCSLCGKELEVTGKKVGEDKDGPIYKGNCPEHNRQFYQIVSKTKIN